MSCTIVVGGQYGSEGKGKVVALRASGLARPWVVRCGGPNSGHTVTIKGEEVVLRQVPTGVVNPSSTLLLAAGCIVDQDLLRREMELLGIDRSRVVVDPRAVLVTPDDQKNEQSAVLSIGSTGSGTGAALVRRIARESAHILASASSELQKLVRVESVAPLLHEELDRGGDILIEGTQGFGLSLLHGPDYPFVTARDTSAAGFASEVGISPRAVDDIIVVVRTFPIRVGGNSGPFADEISWAEVSQLSGAPKVLPEYTSVTKRLRRVARFDLEAVVTACRYNRPTELAVMGLDRLEFSNKGAQRRAELSKSAQFFVEQLELATAVPVTILGTGFATGDAILAQSDDCSISTNKA